MNRPSLNIAATPPPLAPRDSQPVRSVACELANIPAWARTADCRELLDRIANERPDLRTYDNGCSAYGGEEYTGRNARLLRDSWIEFGMALGDRDAWEAMEKPTALIRRVLA